MATTLDDFTAHLAFSLIAGTIVWILFADRNRKHLLWSLLAALMSGVLIDADHLIDYYLAFGVDFRLNYFLQGYEIVKSGKQYLFLHGYEYLVILVTLFFIVKNQLWRMVITALIFSMVLHLAVDMSLYRVPASSYSLVYRANHHFDMQLLVSPDDYRKLLEKRLRLGL